MKLVENRDLNLLTGGARESSQGSMTFGDQDPQAGPKEEFAIGFLRAAGAWACYVITEGIKHWFSGNNKKNDDKDESDKDARHSYRGSVGSRSTMGGYSF